MSKKLNIELRFVTGCRQAVEVCANFQPDLILVDISTLGLGGKESTKQIRKGEAETSYHVPIVALMTHLNLFDKASVLNSSQEG